MWIELCLLAIEVFFGGLDWEDTDKIFPSVYTQGLIHSIVIISLSLVIIRLMLTIMVNILSDH